MTEYDIGIAFRAIEDELMASMIRNMDRHRAEETREGYDWSMWQTEQLRALEKYKRENRKRYHKQFRDINSEISALLIQARQAGNMQQEIQILNAIQRGYRFPHIPKRLFDLLEDTDGKTFRQRASILLRRFKGDAAVQGTAEFFKLNNRKLEALIQATTHDMEKAETAVLRMANDQYRKIIFNAQVYANTGAGTYEKAVDMATKDMLAAGLNCVEYKNGARHTLSDYADMAIRTASKRAYLQGEGEKRQEWGISTVIMNKRGNPCPKCLPFCGKVLIDDVWSGGKQSDGPYPLMSAAIAAGLYHPRCKDSHTTYFPDISTADDAWTQEELRSIELTNKREAQQQYAERQSVRYNRLAKYSLDPGNRTKYRLKEKEWKLLSNDIHEQDESDIFARIKASLPGSVERQVEDFVSGLEEIQNVDIKTLLMQAKGRTTFKRSKKKRSYYNTSEKTIYLTSAAGRDTIAHELFHEIDNVYSLTNNGLLSESVRSDFKRLQNYAKGYGKSIPEMLYLKYPKAFIRTGGVLRMDEKYRGISDIINGMSDGDIDLGYIHSKAYWERQGMLEKETWAQFGRILYTDDPEVIEMLEFVCGDSSKEVYRTLKGMIK